MQKYLRYCPAIPSIDRIALDFCFASSECGVGMASFEISAESALSILSIKGWFAERPEPVKALLRRIARVRRYGPGEPLYLHGDEANGIFGLADGALDVTIPRADGMDLSIHRADAGFWIGDLALFVGQTRLVSVVAATPSIVIHFPQSDLRQLVDAAPELIPEFYALTYENMATALRLLANLAISSSEMRVAVRLLMYEDAPRNTGLHMSQNKLAELVGLSVPTLQRVLRRLQEEKLIKVGYGRIRVLDRQGLLSICHIQSSV